MEDSKLIALTRQEAELLMDSFRVSNPLTRDICLKAASVVLEFAAQDSIRDAQHIVANTSDMSVGVECT